MKAILKKAGDAVLKKQETTVVPTAAMGNADSNKPAPASTPAATPPKKAAAPAPPAAAPAPPKLDVPPVSNAVQDVVKKEAAARLHEHITGKKRKPASDKKAGNGDGGFAKNQAKQANQDAQDQEEKAKRAKREASKARKEAENAKNGGGAAGKAKDAKADAAKADQARKKAEEKAAYDKGYKAGRATINMYKDHDPNADDTKAAKAEKRKGQPSAGDGKAAAAVDKAMK